MIIDCITHGEQETTALAASFARSLKGGDVVALNGALGAGKTSFVRGLAQGLQLDPAAVSSPTFTLSQVYSAPTTTKTTCSLTHIDAYRINDMQELEHLGWDELLESTDTIIVLEWAQRIADALPPQRIDIDFEHLDQQKRSLRFTIPDALISRFTNWISTITSDQNNCPVCHKPVPPASLSFPFCSSRCRYVDLGKWFDESYRVPEAQKESENK